MTLRICQGDLVEQEVEAIVNAANPWLEPGAGVCGAILKAGGEEIFEQCEELSPIKPGQAVLTTAGSLPAKWVIHAVGPVWRGGGHHEHDVLAAAYEHSLGVAWAWGIKTIAFPSLSTGIFGFPLDRAAPVAVRTVKQFEHLFDEVRFVLYDEETYAAYLAASL